MSESRESPKWQTFASIGLVGSVVLGSLVAAFNYDPEPDRPKLKAFTTVDTVAPGMLDIGDIAKTPEEQQLARALIQIRNPGPENSGQIGACSGFYAQTRFGPRIVTAEHCLGHKPEATELFKYLLLPDGNTGLMRAGIVQGYETNSNEADIAYFEAPVDWAEPMEITYDTPQIGEKLVNRSFAGIDVQRQASGVFLGVIPVSTLRQLNSWIASGSYIPEGVNFGMVLIDPELQGDMHGACANGGSGSPFMNEAGQVVGVVRTSVLLKDSGGLKEFLHSGVPTLLQNANPDAQICFYSPFERG